MSGADFFLCLFFFFIKTEKISLSEETNERTFHSVYIKMLFGLIRMVDPIRRPFFYKKKPKKSVCLETLSSLDWRGKDWFLCLSFNGFFSARLRQLKKTRYQFENVYFGGFFSLLFLGDVTRAFFCVPTGIVWFVRCPLVVFFFIFIFLFIFWMKGQEPTFG